MRHYAFDQPPADTEPRWLLDMWGIEDALDIWIDADDYEDPYADTLRAKAAARLRIVTGMDSAAARHTLMELDDEANHGTPHDYEQSLEALARMRLTTP